MKITWSILPPSAFIDQKGAWHDLCEHYDHRKVLDFDFAALLVEHFSEPRDRLAVAYQGGDPVAITVMREKNLSAWETFRPSQSLIGLWLQHPSISVEVLLNSLLKALPGFPLVIGLSQQDPNILRRPDFGPRLMTFDHLETATITLPNNFEEFWEARPKNVRKQIARRMKRLAEVGITPQLGITATPSDVASAISDYSRLESAGWKGQQGTAVDYKNPQGGFYHAVMEMLCRKNAGRIYRYWFNDQLAAMELVMVVENMAVFLKTTYEESLKAYAPGILMRREILKDLVENTAVRHIEFYGPLREWQAHWSDATRILYHINFYRHPLAQRMHAQVCRIRSALGRVSMTESLETVKTNGRGGFD